MKKMMGIIKVKSCNHSYLDKSGKISNPISIIFPLKPCPLFLDTRFPTTEFIKSAIAKGIHITITKTLFPRSNSHINSS